VKAKLGALVHISREHFREAFEQAALGTPVTEAPPTSKSNPTKDPYAQDESASTDCVGALSAATGAAGHRRAVEGVGIITFRAPCTSIRFVSRNDSIAENGRLVAYPA
jgi:hypothetical protein